MALKLYNTLTQKMETVQPHHGAPLGMYTCGPTVYDFAHLGNFRTFIFQDLLRRYLKYKKTPLLHVMNITDVDDKIINNARAAGMSIQDYMAGYSDAFFVDMERLRVKRPDIVPYATQHIPEMIELILKLRERGHTYERDGSTYFRISSFAGYGKLSHLDRSTIETEGRVDADEYSKENPRDFVLWKARKPEEPYWDSPLGPGRPGWHIECSAMSMKYLGETFDLHCGGVDLIFPHHENEIAQSEGATGFPFVRHWIHSEFLIVEGERMSKSKGNFYTLRDLLQQGYNPIAVRYLLQSVNYRRQLNFTFDGIQQSQAALQRVNDFLLRVREIPSGRPENPVFDERLAQARADFEAAMDDDLNVSGATAALFELVKDANPLLERQELGPLNRDHILDFFSGANSIFDVFQIEQRELPDAQIERLIEERAHARRERNYRRADEIRDLLARSGIILEDTKEGTRWKALN
ncbi:MAG: cysteine--tRNA ligase [Acidobacteria bacterium]|nr:cysteine--tRNA ligase [Acidobacteriota bacterium]